MTDKPRVLLVDPALGGLVPRFAERLGSDVPVGAVSTFDAAELRALASDAEVFVNARRRIDREAIAAAPRLRLVQMIGVGTDPLDLDALAERGVLAAYNPGVNRTGAAEHTIMLMLALIKRLPASDRATREGRFLPGEIIATGIGDLAGATVGIVGMGQIGQAVAERLVAFGSRIVYHARRRVPEAEARFGAEWLPLDELLARSNVVTLHIPLSPATRHVIGAAELARMQRGAWLVNAGRGGLVDEAALRVAIESGQLAGAALDVLENETDGGNPFADLPQVIVTPHLGGGSRNSMSAVVERCVANIERLLRGDPLADVVERDSRAPAEVAPPR
ncbi:MAG: 2-hydroxyacid dehydrogenase [Chloroflexota bacterium]